MYACSICSGPPKRKQWGTMSIIQKTLHETRTIKTKSVNQQVETTGGERNKFIYNSRTTTPRISRYIILAPCHASLSNLHIHGIWYQHPWAQKFEFKFEFLFHFFPFGQRRSQEGRARAGTGLVMTSLSVWSYQTVAKVDPHPLSPFTQGKYSGII